MIYFKWGKVSSFSSSGLKRAPHYCSVMSVCKESSQLARAVLENSEEGLPKKRLRDRKYFPLFGAPLRSDELVNTSVSLTV
jgi:hypothetical protein